MKNMNHIELSVELMSILRALNYSCELKTIEGKSIVMDIAVQGELSVRHQKMIEMLLGGFLSEFYWVNGKHHIYIREECKGLLPDDDRYSCLIYEMNKVSSDEERINSYGKEYFFNLGRVTGSAAAHCKRCRKQRKHKHECKKSFFLHFVFSFSFS